jgi:hypothetical protein
VRVRDTDSELDCDAVVEMVADNEAETLGEAEEPNDRDAVADVLSDGVTEIVPLLLPVRLTLGVTDADNDTEPLGVEVADTKLCVKSTPAADMGKGFAADELNCDDRPTAYTTLVLPTV